MFFADLEQGPRDSADHLLQKSRSDKPDPDHGIAGLIQILTGKGGHRKPGDLRLEDRPDRGFPRVSAGGLEHLEIMFPHQAGDRLLHGNFIQPAVNPPGDFLPLGQIGGPLKEVVAVLLLDRGPLGVKLLGNPHGFHDPNVAWEQ